jgi:hypothetical protein
MRAASCALVPSANAKSAANGTDPAGALAHLRWQGIVRVAITVEPSSNVNWDATGQPPRGQLLGRMMP